jgi:hypothetical protein
MLYYYDGNLLFLRTPAKGISSAPLLIISDRRGCKFTSATVPSDQGFVLLLFH